MNENKIAPTVYEFDPTIYPRKLWIAVTSSSLKYKFENISEFDKSAYAMVDNVYDLAQDKGGVLIRFDSIDAMSVGNIAHESIHAACEILDYVGSFIDTKNQEHLAYLAGWIAKCCENVRDSEYALKINTLAAVIKENKDDMK